ncbi:histidine kinase dimerization/phosphoacceptor domain -containing protein [Spirosoma sp.]|uniref:histidine kinase dimerization/phosphoacceptor domain -containing protein n=1 Tax=Spirosoma sp. TaxID=1899569 RepID=UPI003B3A40C6
MLAIGLQTVLADGQPINRQQVNRLLDQLRTSQPNENRLPILLELGKFHIYKPGESKIDLDSGRTYLLQAKKLSDSLHLVTWQHDAESMLVIADMEGGNNQLGRARFAQLIRDCQQKGDRMGEANTRFRLGVWLRNVDSDYRPVFANFRQAAAIYKSLRKPEKEILALKEIGDTYLYAGKLDSAEATLLHVVKRYKSIRYPNLHYTYNSLSSVGTLKGDYAKGLRYALLCIDSMHKTGDTISAAAFYGDLGRIYDETGNHRKAIEWFKKSLAKWRQEKLPNFALFNTAGFIAKDLIAQKKPREALRLIEKLVQEIPTNTVIQKACVAQNLAYCYDALHNPRLAEQYYKETLTWYAKNGLDFEASQQAEQDIGTFYFEQKDFRKAGFHLEKALSFFPQKNSLSTIKDIHLLLFKVDSAQGKYVEAIRHFRMHKALNDSLFNETKSKQITSLQINYDTRQKEQDIALLRKQSSLQQIELAHEKTTRNGFIAGAILLAGLLGVSYNQYRLKKRSNQLLEAKQAEINQKNSSLEQVLGEKERLLDEKEWMLREIHHRVKNNLQVITSLLNAQSDFLDDSTALTAIKDSQNRVQAMALIHQKLYQSDKLDQVNMAEFIEEIVDYLKESFSPPNSVRIVLELAPIQLDVTMATPIGLIINEAFTNALKYAFPQKAGSTHHFGTIQIKLQPLNDQLCRLVISDDGVGLPDGLHVENSATLGLTMIRGLSQQIGGKLQISQNEGLQIWLEFSPVKRTERNLPKSF